jgi:hypothetical protein
VPPRRGRWCHVLPRACVRVSPRRALPRSASGIVAAFPALRTLDLRDNELATAGDLSELVCLERVDLSGNYLRDPDDLVRLADAQALTWLDVSENCLTALGRKALEGALGGRPVTLRM